MFQGCRRRFLHEVTRRSHGSATRQVGLYLLYCVHGPRGRPLGSAAVTSGTCRAALAMPENAVVARFSRLSREISLPSRRCRAEASQGKKKRRRLRRRLHLNILVNHGVQSRLKCAESRVNTGFSRVFPCRPALSRLCQIRCPLTNVIHFAAFKKHISIFPGGEATEVFAERLAGYKTSKGTIQFPLNKPIDYQLIADITQWRIKQAGERQK